jgi:hypothetical protein
MGAVTYDMYIYVNIGTGRIPTSWREREKMMSSIPPSSPCHSFLSEHAAITFLLLWLLFDHSSVDWLIVLEGGGGGVV